MMSSANGFGGSAGDPAASGEQLAQPGQAQLH